MRQILFDFDLELLEFTKNVIAITAKTIIIAVRGCIVLLLLCLRTSFKSFVGLSRFAFEFSNFERCLV
jgi:hypothetical protein